jgi:hypothetical protein
VSIQSGAFYSPTYGGASPDKRFLLMESGHQTLDILNVATLETTTIAQIPDGTMIYGVWNNDGLITVTIWKDDYFRGQLGRWLVHLNL